MKRAIVCGGRDIPDTRKWRAIVRDALEHFEIKELIHGGCRGADIMAASVAGRMDILVREVPAQWQEHGKRAGPMRNKKMLELKPDIVFALPGGKGTRNMVEQALQANVVVVTLSGRETIR